MAGPLAGVRVIEFAGIGPGPMCAMLFADLGATVLRIDRIQKTDLGLSRPIEYDFVLRNRHGIALDLKKSEHVNLICDLVGNADGLIEGFRPGTMERLGLGPAELLGINPKLVYGRMTGWGQSGPLSLSAGHDINYLALTGALASIGRANQPPTVPLNLIGDYGGGSLYLAFGMLAAMLEARRSGLGQVVDAAIVDGAASLMTAFYGLHAAGMMQEPRGENLIDGGNPFYDVYQCADGKWVSIGPLEGRFFDELLKLMGIDARPFSPQYDKTHWAHLRKVLTSRFSEKTRDEWAELLERTDACFAPVLDCTEAPLHPHMRDRGTFVTVDGKSQPGPAPRFSRTPPSTPVAFAPPSATSLGKALTGWLTAERIDALTRS